MFAWWKLVEEARASDLEVCGYLRRWVLHDGRMSGKDSVYLHNLLGPDEPVPHTHPFDFDSVILHGGYVERVGKGSWGEAVHSAGDRWRSRGAAPHWISEVQPDTWTLVVAGPRCRDWGFWVTPTEFVSHLDRHAQGKVIYRHGYEREGAWTGRT